MTHEPQRAGCVRRWQEQRDRALKPPHGMTTYSVVQAAHLLGVYPTTLRCWMREHRIAFKRIQCKPVAYGITHAALRRFIAAHALCVLSPAPEIATLVRNARQVLEVRYISTSDLAKLLERTIVIVKYLRKVHGFPEPTFQYGTKQGGSWYDRAAARAWLCEHPQYQTTSTKARL